MLPCARMWPTSALSVTKWWKPTSSRNYTFVHCSNFHHFEHGLLRKIFWDFFEPTKISWMKTWIHENSKGLLQKGFHPIVFFPCMCTLAEKLIASCGCNRFSPPPVQFIILWVCVSNVFPGAKSVAFNPSYSSHHFTTTFRK